MRIRQLGVPLGVLQPGPLNAITDVAGVMVGHTTLVSGEGALRPGQGPVRTGVTVILPHGGNLFERKVPAAVFTLNGYGKAAGFEQVRELGNIEAPIALTNTLNVGLVLDALVQYMIQQSPQIGISASTVNILVGETNDGYLNDIQGRHVRPEHVWHALHAASNGSVEEGSVGAGTGTCCLGWKGGIGSASRVSPPEDGGFTLGALVQTNFGRFEDLVVCGVPVGRMLEKPLHKNDEMPGPGSVMVVLATDAPLDSRQLQRLCLRAAAGLVRTGAVFSHGSGDFVIAFSTARLIENQPRALTGSIPAVLDEPRVLNSLFRAVIESVEEAVLNSLSMSGEMIGRDGHVAFGLPLDEVRKLVLAG